MTTPIRSLLLAICFSTPLSAQVTTSATPFAAQAVSKALTGEWTGVLEYRDYQSDGRVKLPTWLRIQPEGAGLRFSYIYDDGPTKTVTESDLVLIDESKGTYTLTTSDPKDKPSISKVTGLDKLKEGRGTLVLSGTGTDNDKPVDVRQILKIQRNLIEILRETRLANEEFKFRHVYVFTRSTPPETKGAVQH